VRRAMNTRKEPAMATTPESFVDAINSAFGKQTTQRAAHAKGDGPRERIRYGWRRHADSAHASPSRN